MVESDTRLLIAVSSERAKSTALNLPVISDGIFTMVLDSTVQTDRRILPLIRVIRSAMVGASLGFCVAVAMALYSALNPAATCDGIDM
jgi:drug/metabolite transporter (DMT)-like permease